MLDGFGRRQTKKTVIGAIVRLSDDIAHGYEGWLGLTAQQVADIAAWLRQ